MVLKLIKSNRKVNYLLLPLIGGLFWLKSLLNPYIYSYYRGESGNLLYLPFDRLVSDSALIQSAVSLVMIIILALIIDFINNEYNFIYQRTILPSVLFIMITGGFTDMHTMHPVYFGAFFLLIAVYRLFSSFNQAKSYSASFDSGFFLGIASLFYFNIFMLFPALLYGIGTLTRERNWREFVLITTGFILPFFFAFCYTYLTGQFLELLKIFEINLLTANNHLVSNISLQFYVGYLILLTITGSYKILSQYDNLKVSTRKFFVIFFLLFVCSVAGIIVIPAASQEILVIAGIPLTYLVSNYFMSLKSRFWEGFLVTTFIAIVIIMQIIS